TTGKRLSVNGINTPLKKIKQTKDYSSLGEAKEDITKAAGEITASGLPESVKPLIIAVTGDGNVSKGAMEILDLLPGEYIPAADLKIGNYDKNQDIIKVNLLVSDYMTPPEGREFDLGHYINNPDLYTSTIKDYLPEIDVFVNGIYWDDRYPRLITKDWLREMDSSNRLNLKVIGDITCDIHGSIECTETATPIEDPVFIYNSKNDSYEMGFEGRGVAVMAVDILPSELPREASIHFSESLRPYLKSIAKADFSIEDLSLPAPIKNAVIVHNGKLMPDYSYLQSYLPA
ncbi:MAG: hypothetical protein R3220_06300, partial [Balneolaceae bacterium]|nr:hypothetical protein [Balneolaceae bacterium]